jgi:hypothetical protein
MSPTPLFQKLRRSSATAEPIKPPMCHLRAVFVFVNSKRANSASVSCRRRVGLNTVLLCSMWRRPIGAVVPMPTLPVPKMVRVRYVSSVVPAPKESALMPPAPRWSHALRQCRP